MIFFFNLFIFLFIEVQVSLDISFTAQYNHRDLGKSSVFSSIQIALIKQFTYNLISTDQAKP